jgi:hypothetical protein
MRCRALWGEDRDQRALPARALRRRDQLERERERPSLSQTLSRFVEVLEETLSNVVAFANVKPSPRRVDGVHAGRARRSLTHRAMRKYVAVVAFTDHDSPPASASTPRAEMRVRLSPAAIVLPTLGCAGDVAFCAFDPSENELYHRLFLTCSSIASTGGFGCAVWNRSMTRSAAVGLTESPTSD